MTGSPATHDIETQARAEPVVEHQHRKCGDHSWSGFHFIRRKPLIWMDARTHTDGQHFYIPLHILWRGDNYHKQANPLIIKNPSLPLEFLLLTICYRLCKNGPFISILQHTHQTASDYENPSRMVLWKWCETNFITQGTFTAYIPLQTGEQYLDIELNFTTSHLVKILSNSKYETEIYKQN